MFSITTILSSTTRPAAIAKPPKVRMLRLMPWKYMMIKPLKILTGIDTLVTKVGLALSRKAKMIRHMIQTAMEVP